MKPKPVTFTKSYRMVGTSFLTSYEQSLLKKVSEDIRKEVDMMAYCALAGISEEEYKIRMGYPRLFEPEKLDTIDATFKQEGEDKDE